jgi:hypothetical protein
MSLIKPKPKIEKIQVRVNMDSLVVSDIKQYCKYAGFSKMDEFLEEAANFVMWRDKEFKDWKESCQTPPISS